MKKCSTSDYLINDNAGLNYLNIEIDNRRDYYGAWHYFQ